MILFSLFAPVPLFSLWFISFSHVSPFALILSNEINQINQNVGLQDLTPSHVRKWPLAT